MRDRRLYVVVMPPNERKGTVRTTYYVRAGLDELAYASRKDAQKAALTFLAKGHKVRIESNRPDGGRYFVAAYVPR